MRAVAGLVRAFVVVALIGLAAAPAAGASAGDVAALQVALHARGLYAGAVDGIDGPATAAAVRAFQRGAGLAADGVAGPATRRALGWQGRPSLGRRPITAGARGGGGAGPPVPPPPAGLPPGGVGGGARPPPPA